MLFGSHSGGEGESPPRECSGSTFTRRAAILRPAWGLTSDPNRHRLAFRNPCWLVLIRAPNCRSAPPLRPPRSAAIERRAFSSCPDPSSKLPDRAFGASS